MKKQLKLKSSVKNFICVFIVLILVGAVAYSGFNIATILYNQAMTTEEVLYHYTTDEKVVHEAILKENAYIDDDDILNEHHYITDLVKLINADASFTFVGEKSIPMEVTYDIVGSLTGSYEDRDNNNKLIPVWLEDTTFLEEVTEEKTGATVVINESFSIDIESLLERITEFEESIGIAIKADYKVNLTINIKTTIDGKEKDIKHLVYLHIPLDGEIFEIFKTPKLESNHKITEEIKEHEIDYIFLIILILVFGGSLFIVLICSHRIINQKTPNDELEIHQIQKDYSNRIVIVENIPHDEETEFIEITIFDELIDLINELNLPILSWTNEEEMETWFCVIKDEIIYRYIVKGE